MLVAHQPEGASFRSDVVGWSNDLGVDWLVDDFREYLPVIAFAIGLVFGFSFDTKGPRVRRARAVEADRDVRAVPAEDRAAADEPMTAERRTVATPSEPHLGDGTTSDEDRVVTTRQGTTADDDRVVTRGDKFVQPDLSRVDEVGFADLHPGSGHGWGGFVNVSRIEVYGAPVKR